MDNFIELFNAANFPYGTALTFTERGGYRLAIRPSLAIRGKDPITLLEKGKRRIEKERRDGRNNK